MGPQLKEGIWRKRDFLILGVMGLTVFLSFDSPSFNFSLEPAWYLEQRYKSMLQPVICDLNGDGKKEVVLILRDENEFSLRVISADPPNKDKTKIYAPEVITSVSLSSLKVTKGQVPVALKTGYVDSYDPVKGRSQVIVVVREDWTVSCFDSSLKLLWEKAIGHKTHDLEHLIDKFEIDEVTIYLTPLSIRDDLGGLVIVGANMKLRDPDPIIVQEGLRMNENGELEHPEMGARADLEHFSVYALDAATGHVIWRHDGLDVRPGQYITGLPQFAYKLNMHDLMTKSHHAPTVTDWTVFRQSLIAELPHDWHSTDDTSLRLAHFERQHIGATSNNRKNQLDTKGKAGTAGKVEKSAAASKRQLGHIASGSGKRFTGVESPPLSLSASLPHDASEHTDHPNVIVAHTSKGVEVIALKTGSPVTSLALSKGDSYADIDGDGVVDTIMVLENEQEASIHGRALDGEEDNQLQHCTLIVTSGLPTRSRLFSGTVCSRSQALQESLSNPAYQSKRSKRNNKDFQRAQSNNLSSGKSIPSAISAASPVILKTIDPKTLLESKMKNVVVAINTGIITCYSANGEFKWQTRGGARWTVDPETSHSGSGSAILFDSDASRVDNLGKHDNVHAQILVVGDSKMTLVSREGDILATTDLPRKPIAHPVIGDFDSDGVTDVIIVTDEAVLGYRLEVIQSSRGMLLAVVVLCLITAIIFFTNIQMIPLSDIASASSNANGGSITRLVKQSVLTLSRSTDESHMD